MSIPCQTLVKASEGVTTRQSNLSKKHYIRYSAFLYEEMSMSASPLTRNGEGEDIV